MKCPRCDADTVRVMTKSPVGDVWEVYVLAFYRRNPCT